MAEPYGRSVRHEFALDEEFLTVNHGSFGATPRAVQAAQDAWRARMEAQPTRFVVCELPAALRQAAAALAGFVGAEPDDLAFVENATVGCNAVLRSLALQPGDEIAVFDHGYGAVIKAAQHVAERAGARVVTVALPFPHAADAEIVAALSSALGPRTRLAIVDHITSPSALVLPVADIAAACRAAGVPLLVDGAHAAGNIDLDVPAIGPDFYVGNCHKWLCAPKGCGFLWARPARQAGLHPVTISHGYRDGFLAEFDWTGTRDMSAYLAVTAALDVHAAQGGAALRARNRGLAAGAAASLARRLGTETNGQALCSMGLVRLPVLDRVDEARALAIRARLLDAGTDAAVSAIGGAAWLRLSAAIYNELCDFERLAEVVCEVLAA